MPVSRIIEGLTVTGGTGSTWSTNHSGLAVLGSYPRSVRSSSGMWLSLSRIVIGRSLFSPASVLSTNIVGFVNIRSYCSLPQCGQSLTFLARSMISSLMLSSVMTAYAAFVSRIDLSCASSSGSSFILLQDRQVISKSLCMSSTNAIWSTGSASSMCPKWPGHFADVLPQVAHFWPGSSVPSLLSISPPCTGIPSSSYVSGAVISATENLRTSVGDQTLNFIPPNIFADSSIISITPLDLLLYKEPGRHVKAHHLLQQQ